MNARKTLSILILSAVMAPALNALAQRATGAARTAPPAGVATVGAHTISRADLDRSAEATIQNLSRATGSRELRSSARDQIRRQALESLIRLSLLEQEGRRLGLAGSEQEAEDSIARQPFFNPGGRFDPQRLQAIKSGQPASWLATVRMVQDKIAARRLSAQLEREFSPSEAAARAAAARTLSLATFEHLELRVDDFSGSYPEPREAQIVDYYHAHAADFHREDRAVLTVVFVNYPALTDSIRALPGGAEAWNARMRALADSLLAVVRGGTPLEKAAEFLGPRPNIVVTSDNFPGYWQGNAAQTAQVFDPKFTGRLLPQPVPGVDGWLLIRVDQLSPAHVAPLREVAKEIRALLRQDRRQHHEEYAQRELYARLRDSLAAPGWRLRMATVDTASFAVPEPDAGDLDRFYRGHQADYSSFDPRSGAIVSRPLAEVRDDVRQRFLRERRDQTARALASQLYETWRQDRRDPALESRLGARDLPPVIEGGVIDTGYAARALSDTLWKMGTPQPAGQLFGRRGWIVWQMAGRVERVVPTFEQARPLLAQRLRAEAEAAELEGARALFRADSMKFNLGKVIHFSRFAVGMPQMLDVPLSREELVRWHREHLDRYSAPELVTARHILIEPVGGTPAAERAALEKARSILARLRAGEDFARLARENSDDPATRDKGGDLGPFGRGTMLDAFERAAFALKAGETAPEPVRTEVGYHIIQVTEHLPQVIHPLPMVYSTVGTDAVFAKAEVMAGAQADSLMRSNRTIAALRAGAAKLKYQTLDYTFQFGDTVTAITSRPFFQQLRRTLPGQVLRPPYRMKGLGYWIAWVDSITPPKPPTWQDGRTAALAEYRKGAGWRAALAKKAEMDTLFDAGWSFDSLAALWGGAALARELPAGKGTPRMSNAAGIDSVAFGTSRTPPIGEGQVSGWIESPEGWTRLRIAARATPVADAIADRAMRIRNAELERRYRPWFEDLKKRYPVRISDPVLRDASLPELPPAVDL